MQALLNHIERAKGRPHHVRRKLALTLASGVTGFIALAWFAYSLSTGVFTIQGSTLADTLAPSPSFADPSAPGLAGAAAAPQLSRASEPRIEIIDAKTSAAKPASPEATIIPF